MNYLHTILIKMKPTLTEPIDVISVFDGMSCGQQALESCGIQVNNYYASEVDKYAIKVTMANYPNTIQLGDVRFIKIIGSVDNETQLALESAGFKFIKAPNLFIGGSPCQSFSFAGKRNGMSTKCSIEITTLKDYLELKHQNFEFEGQSYLFWEYMRILTEIKQQNPGVKFLLENVIMGAKWQKILSQAIGINPIEINSALVSAQTRKRLYWTNIGAESSGLFGDMACKIKQPKDKNILLKHILETNVPEKYFLSEKMLEYFNTRAANFNNGKINIRSEEEKATCSNASSKSVDISDNFVIGVVNNNGDLKDCSDKSLCLDANYYKGIDNHGQRTMIVDKNTTHSYIVAMRGRNPENPKSRKSGLKTEQMLEPRTDEKTNCLTTVQKDNLVFGCDYRTDEGIRIRDNEKSGTLAARARNDESCGQLVGIIQVNPSKESGGTQPYQQNRVYDENGLMPALNAELGGRNNVLTKNTIRRLTPIECERLQTVKDNYTNHVSDTQRYKMLGNGWTVDIIAYIFSHLKTEQ